MFYHIKINPPALDRMSGWGFHIDLWPAWREAVALSEINQDKANQAIQTLGASWLDACGYDAIFDPDKSPMDEWRESKLKEKKAPGPNARRLYEPYCIQVRWGEWGPEHITVPGNACGLDIDFGSSFTVYGGRTLLPHNVDCMAQAYLLVMVFSWFASFIVCERELAGLKNQGHELPR